MLYAPGWDEDEPAALLPSAWANDLSCTGRTPRGCFGETVSEGYTAAHRLMHLGSQPPNWACAYVPAQWRRKEKQFPTPLTPTVIMMNLQPYLGLKIAL